MIGAVLVGSFVGMLAGAGSLIAGVPVLLSLAIWSGTGSVAVLVLGLVSLRSRRRAVALTLHPQRA